MISVWKGETNHKGGKFQAILDVVADAIPSKNIKAASLSRDYRAFKNALPEDLLLQFKLHRTK